MVCELQKLRELPFSRSSPSYPSGSLSARSPAQVRDDFVSSRRASIDTDYHSLASRVEISRICEDEAVDANDHEDPLWVADWSNLKKLRKAEGFEIGCLVQAAREIFVGDALAVKAGTHGLVMQPSPTTIRLGRVEVNWDRQENGDCRSIAVIPSYIKKAKVRSSLTHGRDLEVFDTSPWLVRLQQRRDQAERAGKSKLMRKIEKEIAEARGSARAATFDPLSCQQGGKQHRHTPVPYGNVEDEDVWNLDWAALTPQVVSGGA
mmetsp:Transcript_67376/g.105333  ORF Transcript_67376/g.105333 Transcript_67376/m.105333 type:complete len:263 (+) Transcript_67376:49-837(+)